MNKIETDGKNEINERKFKIMNGKENALYINKNSSDVKKQDSCHVRSKVSKSSVIITIKN